MTEIPTDPKGRPLYPADIADLDPAKVFAAGVRLPVRVVDFSDGSFWEIQDRDQRCIVTIFFGFRRFGIVSSESARGIATAIAKAINSLGGAA